MQVTFIEIKGLSLLVNATGINETYNLIYVIYNKWSYLYIFLCFWGEVKNKMSLIDTYFFLVYEMNSVPFESCLNFHN